MTSDEGSAARLEKIQGGIDLIAERLKSANDLNNERHATLQGDITDLRTRHNNLSGRVVILEADKDIRAGERQGVSNTVKVLWTALGTSVAGLIAFAAQYLK